MMTSKHTNDPDFIGWLANEFDGGVFQDLPEASLEDGEHYENARDWYERVCTTDQGARAEREYAEWLRRQKQMTKHTPEHPHFEVAMIGASCGDYISVTGSFGITVYTDLDGEVIYSNVTEHYEHFGHMVALAQRLARIKEGVRHD